MEFFFVIVTFIIVLQIRNEIVHRARIKQINIDFNVYLNAPGYFEMVFDLTKWTRKQLFNTEV